MALLHTYVKPFLETTQELEHGQTKEGFIKDLINSLKANMYRTAYYPRLRREVVE